MADQESPEFETHEVLNQSKPLVDYNLFTTNLALQEALQREGGDWAWANLTVWGEHQGRAQTMELARLANKYTPVARLFDRFGNRIDEVEFHPAWHETIGAAVAQGIHSAPWAEPKKGAHVARAVSCMMQAEIEDGVQCPITMTYGSVPTIAKRSDIAAIWLPKIYSRQYDQRFIPITEKKGALIGMGMTEKQGGSDVRTNTTKATLIAGSNGEYDIVGHKWFFSAPMCDAFLVLAQAEKGLSCFFMPRWLPDGTKNAIRIQRLKEKVGNNSNASSEVEFHHAHGWLIGEEGRGVPTIIEMANYTRLDCSLGTTGLMRQCVAQAINHATYREAFNRKLVDHPLMQNVLADLALEYEGAVALAMRVARAYDAQDDEAEAHFKRVVTPTAKYWICKRGPAVAVEAMEVMGGNGYVDEGPLGRLYKAMPLNSIWEGSGNIMCLDMLRAFGKTPEALDVVQQEWRQAKGANASLDRFAASLEADVIRARTEDVGPLARRLAERLALCISASLLVRHAPNAVSEAFCSSRLDRDWGSAFGTLNADARCQEIIDRSRAVEHKLAKPVAAASRVARQELTAT
jgi:putative acyl-CoA dehydrogenase